MRRTEIEKGVVYAYRPRSLSRFTRPVVFLSRELHTERDGRAVPS